MYAIIKTGGKQYKVCEGDEIYVEKIDAEDGAEVELELLFAENVANTFLEKLTDMTAGTVEGMETGKEYRAFPI